ncbi:MAG: Lytic transglycosylase [candidate division WWE3 bacterium GW2011_GWA1_46_21]|uniref:Lytic transglycosylase n=4 Tax=Katanobacteria TaxID=422282 RepID=A0A0G1PDL6_UNCKA|nr:MAG: Lytic transglycosylase [candidate division WWE3 bacterium GW2011_GWA1_46_21]KKU48946.1 MAG: Lytic transglycosylase [candidate division WWE3 bacterium GW2011_GWA2_46_9]KKU51080.1 MAG: Lytic transglycosylase [candidate division WWE3 bacterium GW2011_GWC1_47_10]KKU57616.1 MAG: Lytic transglycosylase [candidate division WWE3 bacterium GW2011_GWB1_47_11]
MVDLAGVEILRKRKQALLQEQKTLVEMFKKKHSSLYSWLIEKQINVEDLRKYSASIAAALVVSLSAASPEKQPPKELVPQVVEIRKTELQGLSEDQKVALVWNRYGDVINRVSAKYDLDPNVILATIMIESGGDAQAIRHEPRINDASYGLGQILYGTATGIGYRGVPEKLYDPEVNIELIGRYHRRNLNVYGDLTPQQLTTAYNAGSPYSYALPGHVAKFNKFYEKSKEVTSRNV